jgi:O6-methylguanine-DNA--protein-cysteine methyltransferase
VKKKPAKKKASRPRRAAIPAAPGTLRIESPVGPLLLVARAAGLTHLLFGKRIAKPPAGDRSADAARILRETERQIREYFDGRRRAFDIPLAPEGTPFQLEVWQRLREIPYGETISYGDLAQRLGKPTASRAVGAANGANPISIDRLAGGRRSERRQSDLDHRSMSSRDRRRSQADRLRRRDGGEADAAAARGRRHGRGASPRATAALIASPARGRRHRRGQNVNLNPIL